MEDISGGGRGTIVLKNQIKTKPQQQQKLRCPWQKTSGKESTESSKEKRVGRGPIDVFFLHVNFNF